MTVRSIEHRTKVPEIRKGDTVVVLAGKDAGKRGTVEQVIRRDPVADDRCAPATAGRRLKGGVFVVVQGLNIARKHTKPRQRSRVARAPCRPSIRAASSITRCRSRRAG